MQQLHQASITVRYGSGLEANALIGVRAAIDHIAQHSHDDLLTAP